MLVKFLLTRVVRCIDTQSIFRSEPVHLFSLDMIQVLKKCFQNLFEDPNQRSSAVKAGEENYEKSILTTRHSILKD